jgi:thiamine biosynthesis lipoprotein
MKTMKTTKSMKTMKSTMISSAWQQIHFAAMNTEVSAWWYGDGSTEPQMIEALFRGYEGVLSRFDPSSDLSQLNRSELQLSPVSAPLYDALQAALWAAAVTGGLYDPTLLAELEQAGYDRSFDLIVERAQFQWPVVAPKLAGGAGEAAGRPWDWRSVQLEAEQQAVRRPRGLRFDLGGMGKGWTVDRTADLLHGQGPFLVNAGGDLYAGGRPDGVQGWRVEIEHPLRPQETIASVQLQDAALATSTVTKRRWRKEGNIRHHLIDPRSGKPAQTDALSVSVIAGRTLIAEVHAKAALLLGAEAGLAYLAATPGVEGLIYRSDGQVLYTGGCAQLLVGLNSPARRGMAA